MTISPKIAPVVGGLIMGTVMSLIMSGLVTFVNTGMDAGYPDRWLGNAWPAAWCAAVPLASIGIVVMPKILARLTGQHRK